MENGTSIVDIRLPRWVFRMSVAILGSIVTTGGAIIWTTASIYTEIRKDIDYGKAERARFEGVHEKLGGRISNIEYRMMDRKNPRPTPPEPRGSHPDDFPPVEGIVSSTR